MKSIFPVPKLVKTDSKQLQALLISFSSQCIFSIATAWCRHETAAEDAAVLPSLTHQAQPAVYCLKAVYYLSTTVWQLSESFSILCLCFVTRESTVNQQVQSASVCVNSDQVTEQPSRCKLSVSKKTRRAVCSYTEQPRESCTETRQRF